MAGHLFYGRGPDFGPRAKVCIWNPWRYNNNKVVIIIISELLMYRYYTYIFGQLYTEMVLHITEHRKFISLTNIMLHNKPK